MLVEDPMGESLNLVSKKQVPIFPAYRMGRSSKGSRFAICLMCKCPDAHVSKVGIHIGHGFPFAMRQPSEVLA